METDPLERVGCMLMAAAIAAEIVAMVLDHWILGLGPLTILLAIGWIVGRKGRRQGEEIVRVRQRQTESTTLEARRKARKMALDKGVASLDVEHVLRAGQTSIGNDSQNAQERRFQDEVVAGLVHIGRSKGIAPIVAALRPDELLMDRVLLFRALAELRDPSSLAPLMAHFNVKQRVKWSEQKPLEDALEALGNLAVEPLIDIVKEPYAHEQPKWAAIRLLGIVGDHRATPVLLSLLHTTFGHGAAEALTRLGVREAVPVMIELLDMDRKKGDSNSASIMAGYLAELGDPSAIGPIEKAMAEIHPNYISAVREKFQSAVTKLQNQGTV